MILTLAVLLLLATFSTKITGKLGVPGLVVFLSLGMIFGGGALNIVDFRDPVLAQQIANVCLLFILFEGGLNTKKSILKVTAVPAGLLATVGVIVTAFIHGLLVHFILGLELPIALLLGAITSSTDAAAVFATFKDKLVKPRISATLESESASNDPMAIILTTTVIQFIQGSLDSPLLIVSNLVWQMVAGFAIGFLVAKIGVMLFNKLRLDGQSFYYVLILGVALLSHGLAELIGGNGFLAVFVTGVVIGNSEFVFKRGIALFMEGISTFTHVILFLILGLLVFPGEAILVWREGVMAAVLLMLVARPIAVFLTVAFNKYSFKEKLFLSWAGIKGSVPIVLGTYPLVAGIEQGQYIFNLVFFIVVCSTLVQGSTIAWFAKKTGLFYGFKQRKPHSLELISLEKAQVELVEYDVEPPTQLAGKRIDSMGLPKQALIVSIIRDDDIIAPGGDTVIEEHDVLFVLVGFKHKESTLACLNGEAEEPEEPEGTVESAGGLDPTVA